MDSGKEYYKSQTNPAVIVRADRPDIQMAAIYQDVSCLIVTGDSIPADYSIYEAQEREIPIIAVKSNTIETAKNINKIAKNFDVVVDGSDNFRTRFLINDYCLKNKKILVSGAISKFDGQVYTFNFSKKKSPCLRCFIPKMPRNPDIDNCEYEGVLGTLAGIIGSIQANEVAKEILGIGDTLCGHILICLLYTSPSPRDGLLSRMPSSA